MDFLLINLFRVIIGWDARALSNYGRNNFEAYMITITYSKHIRFFGDAKFTTKIGQSREQKCFQFF